jgi:hypothetical protein
MALRFHKYDPYVDFKKALMKALEDSEEIVDLTYSYEKHREICVSLVVGETKYGKDITERYSLELHRIR